jgi:hypothetical protein
LSFKISISLKLRLFRKPVPRALAKDSLAANLLAKKLVLFKIFLEYLNSSVLN